ncbi:MAG TPA: hypothetical protein VF932_03495 [Anaerolineae bacterium]
MALHPTCWMQRLLFSSIFAKITPLGYNRSILDMENKMEDSPLPEVAPPSVEPVQTSVPPPTPRRTGRFRILPLIMSIVILLVGVVIGYEARPIISPSPATSGPGSTYPIISLLLAQTRHFKGNANAPVTLIEFSDFQ